MTTCTTAPAHQAGHQPAAGPHARSTAPHRPVHRAARGADHRGRAGDVPVARARPTRCGPAPGGRAARPAAAAAVPDTDLWYVTTEHARGVAGRVPVRDHPRRPHASPSSTTRSTPSSRTGRSASSSVCAAAGYEVPDWTLPRPRGPARARSSSGRIAQQGAAPPGALPALPAGALPHRACATRCWSSTTATTTSTTPGQDRARQPDPPQRGRGDGGRVRLAAATGWSSTPTTRRTPGSSPASWCPT